MFKKENEYDVDFTKEDLLKYLKAATDSNVKTLELIMSLTTAVLLLKKRVEQLENERS